MRSFEAETVPARQRPRPALTPPARQRGSEYAQLSRQIKQAGLLERRPGYYVWKIAATAVLLAAGWAVFVLVGDSWWQLGVAAFLAVMFTQVGFLGHDAGHRQVFGSRRRSYLAGLLLGKGNINGAITIETFLWSLLGAVILLAVVNRNRRGTLP